MGDESCQNSTTHTIITYSLMDHVSSSSKGGWAWLGGGAWFTQGAALNERT